MKLPKKPSALIRLALDDLRKVERSKKYVVDMGTYHEPEYDGCHVCLAGAIMAKTLKTPLTRTTGTGFYTEGNKLRALDYLRTGQTYEAFWELSLSCQNFAKFDRDICNYTNRNKNEFHKQMRELARDLEKGGY